MTKTKKIFAGAFGVLLLFVQFSRIPKPCFTAECIGFWFGWSLFVALGWAAIMYSIGRTFGMKKRAAQ